MLLKSLSLQNIRRHKSFNLDLPSKTTIVLGDNASGKTTIAEAIQLLSTGESFRAEKIDEIINFDAELGRVGGVVQENDEETTTLELILTRGVVQGKKTSKRLFSVNEVRRRKKDLVGKLLSIIFRPEDMRLVEGSPSRRRGFVDTALSTVSYQYAHALKTYEATLLRRNKLLQLVREGEQPKSVLQYWNLALVKHGELLQQERQKFFASFVGVEFPVSFSVKYVPSVLTTIRQEEYIGREIASGRTLIGPHKDDFEVILHEWRTAEISTGHPDGISVATYGSRGQQRLAVLWLKMCELHFLEQTKLEKPVLVLDDILSELDEESKNLVLSLLEKYQSIVTTTQEADVDLIKERVENFELLRLKA